MAYPPPPNDPSNPSQHPRSHTIDVLDHRIDSNIDGIRHWRLKRKTASASANDWYHRPPYHEYVHQLVLGGWDNLKDLDTYLKNGPPQQAGIVVSVLDITSGFTTKRWPDIHDEYELKGFMAEDNRGSASVRFYMAEYVSHPATCIIEALGSGLGLDPRFFNWSIGSRGHVFTPSQRHRAPYISLGFGVRNPTIAESSKTDCERIKVLVYVQPDREGDGWTGIVLFSSHTKINLSPRIISDPPPFAAQLPPPRPLIPKSLRELYIESFEFVELEKAVVSPFYAISNLLRLNAFCWDEIIAAIRSEDLRVQGISDNSVSHSEEIRKSLLTVERGGSMGWKGQDTEQTKEVQQALEEDFKHLVDQTDLMWKTRERMASVQQKNSEARWTTLTNAFTYGFAPLTIMTGIYGMNVSQISGSSSNPNIWQFFVAVAGLNFVVLAVLAISNWISVQIKHGRAAGIKEIIRYAVGIA